MVKQMLTLIKNGEVYAPEYLGRQSLLLIGDKIAKIGSIDEEKFVNLDIVVNVIDAEGLMVIPGLIDPHVHLIGGGGEGGFTTRTPEIQLTDITTAGITTVVGCLGTDGVTRHLTSLLAKARALTEEGITAYMYTGNYHVPTPTITSSVKEDIMLIDRVIGAGEIAISDSRSGQPSLHEIAKLVGEARVGGLLSKKAGVTHFHVGPGKARLQYLSQILEDYEIPAGQLYATHITRSKELVDEAIALSNKGVYVDMTCGDDTGEWLKYYKENGGNMEKLSLSSDGNGSLPKFDADGNFIGLGVASPHTLYEQVCEAVITHGFSIEEVLPLVTRNTATVLKLEEKGSLSVSRDADIVLLEKETLALHSVLAKGKTLVSKGKVVVKGTFEK